MDHLTRKQRSANMAAVRGYDTRPERLVRRVLFGLGYRYRLHAPGLPGRPDIAIPKWRRVIFVHGCFWHGHACPRGSTPSTNVTFWRAKIGGNKVRDQRVQRRLRRDGWRVLVIWECETRDVPRLQGRLRRFLEGTSAQNAPRPRAALGEGCPSPRLRGG
ncbi:MAG: very short patch repair endonuclease [Gemmataceae bacterium]